MLSPFSCSKSSPTRVHRPNPLEIIPSHHKVFNPPMPIMFEHDDVERVGKVPHTEVTSTTFVPKPLLRADEGDFVTEHEERDLSRGLHQRHISLIALAGAIGTGLFLGLGGAIQTGGPAGAQRLAIIPSILRCILTLVISHRRIARICNCRTDRLCCAICLG